MFDILETSVIIAVIIAIGSEVLTMFYSIFNAIREMLKKKKEQKAMKEKLEKRKQSKIDKAQMDELPMAKRQSSSKFKTAKMILGNKGGEKRMNRRNDANEGDYGVVALDSVERHRIKAEYAEEVKAKKKQEKELKKQASQKKKTLKLFDAKVEKGEKAKGQSKVFEADEAS